MKLFFAALYFFAALPAFGVTAGDVLDRMTDKEQKGYLSGAIDMAMYQAATQGDNKQSACIVAFYYNSDGKAQRDIVATFAKYRDKPAVALIRALVNRACPASASATK